MIALPLWLEARVGRMCDDSARAQRLRDGMYRDAFFHAMVARAMREGQSETEFLWDFVEHYLVREEERRDAMRHTGSTTMAPVIVRKLFGEA